ncbi:MAG: flagellar hook-basal body protein [Lachnospiraceae bacterium]|nr:flagellar hook-basal body protein [Lachnospiraceae bacterium]
MMRALWSAASGMRAEQTSVDTISNNIANVNTTGYKAQRAQFNTLLYQTLQASTTTANGANKPSSAQVGLGTRVASFNAAYTQGAQLSSANPMALFIAGDGFFSIQGTNNEKLYTRDGDFTWSTTSTKGQLALTTSNGNFVLDRSGQKIEIPQEISAETVAVGQDGLISYQNAKGETVSTGKYIGLFQFPNPVGLEKTAGNLLRPTPASGEAMAEESSGDNMKKSQIQQGYLEGSNVNVADEMVDLIISQRAYELNSKAITTGDSMLQTANELKR